MLSLVYFFRTAFIFGLAFNKNPPLVGESLGFESESATTLFFWERQQSPGLVLEESDCSGFAKEYIDSKKMCKMCYDV